MRFIDTHCHFDFPPFAEHEAEELIRARDAGVQGIVIPAVTASRFSQIISLCERFPSLWYAPGLHPLWIAEHTAEDIDRLQQCLQQGGDKLVAVGEAGLDFYTAEQVAQADKQRSLLQSQLTLARRYDLPVILHSRRSHDPLAALLRKADLPAGGVIHGFSGSLQQANAFVRLGFAIGVGGTITYPRARKTRETIASLPLSALVLETDAPDMPVHGFQGQPNRPEHVVTILQSLAELRPEPPEQLAEVLWQNALRLFPRLHPPESDAD
ncbi:TatD family hydrolase [Tatumella sp. JGM118]|uniref:TatD family hydrolase n=1 Tax=Tatumella sp. JGM118 TaxID=2799796 RepID=UPI001BAF11B9|nr:TatD family hydrolase [Tatumella sp. JGM118]